MKIKEENLELLALEWFTNLGFSSIHGPDLAPGEPKAEREDYSQVVLLGRLKQAIARLNPGVPVEGREEAVRKVLLAESPSLVLNNRAFQKMLADGVAVEYQAKGRIKGDMVRLMDFDNPENNDWLAVNQFTVIEGQNNRRADIVVFVNGLPLAVIELKNPADENADIWVAFNKLKNYQDQIPSLFVYNAVLVISDGLNARIGSLTAGKERFMFWRTIEGEAEAPATALELEVLIKGLFNQGRFLDYVRHFVVFEDDGKKVEKKIAGYHQYHAVNRALQTTLQAAGPKGDKRAGVVWHTQGSGKSLTMVFFAGKIILNPAMKNPTLVVITDRNDLDGQLYGVFSRCHEILRQKPIQAKSRPNLRKLLERASGGVIFTTIQKFFPGERGDKMPILSDRRNIVVIADEAHRSQYDFIDGFARHMRDALPNASFIGFTGTPLELEDKSTRAVFGDYISIYDIEQAVKDKATVPIYYEGRLAKLELKDSEKPKIDPEFEEVTEGEEVGRKEKLKTRWARMEAMVGTEKRIGLIARDIVDHFETRLAVMDGKAMIVAMSRRICVELYNALIKLRPKWHHQDDDRGILKVVMTGSTDDKPELQPHIRNKDRRNELANRFKNPDDPFQIVIVRDMWLTGFDAPSLHTMYVDKPMRSHGLMQAIARVNRVFKDKPGGLVVDYLGLAHELKKAMSTYTESGGKGQTALEQDEAVAVMLEKYEVCRDMFHGFDYAGPLKGKAAERIAILPAAQEHVLKQEDGRMRFTDAVGKLSRAFALAVPHEQAMNIRDEVAFFQAVRAGLKKSEVGGPKTDEALDFAVRQIVSRAVASDKVIDIFSAAGLKKPDISILSEEFLSEVRAMPQKNLAVELLRKLLNDEIKGRARKNLVQSRSFAEMLGKTIRQYQNRTLETAAVIAELIELAKEMREADQRGEELGLSQEERAFYDALEVNDSAVKVLGDETLRKIAQELVETVRGNVTIDWTVKESAKAKLRTMVKRLLRKYGYPPDKQEKATQTVLEQAELLCVDWAA